MGLGLTWGGGDKQLSAQLPTARGSFPPSIPSGYLGTGLRDSRPSRWHGDKRHSNLPPLWGPEGREDLREPRVLTDTSGLDPGEATPFGPGCLLPSQRDPSLQGPVPAGEMPLPPLSQMNGWLWPPRRLSSPSRYKCHPLPTPIPLAREEGRGSKRGGRRGVAKQGRSRDSDNKTLIVPRPHAAPRQSRHRACLPGPGPGAPRGPSELLSNAHQSWLGRARPCLSSESCLC